MGNIENEPRGADARYDMRKQPNGLWTVYDIFTGQPAVVGGCDQADLGIERADDLVDLMNRMYAEQRAKRGG